MKQFALITLFFLTAFAVYGQRSFSRDSAKFIDEYTGYLNNANSDEANNQAKTFKEYWSTGIFDKAMQTKINSFANTMLLNELKAEPNFLLFTQCVNAWVYAKHPQKLLIDFINICEKNVAVNKTGFTSFMATCYPLFKDNIIVQNPQRQWFTKEKDFELSQKGDFSITFKTSDLICKAPVDYMVIEKTSGVFYPEKNLWVGNKGKVTWRRHDNPNAYVEFQEYTLDLNNSEIKVENAQYTNTEFFGGQVKGVFTDKVSYTTDTASINNSSFPEFSTYESNVEIKNLIGKNARYFGGLTIKGEDIFSQSYGDKPATIELLFKGKTKLIAKSASFKIVDKTIKSLRTEVTILMDTGTIYHPRAIFNFNFGSDILIVSRGEEGLTRANFVDNFHNIELEVDNAKWKLEESWIDFDNLSNDKAASFESSNFYKQFRYEKIQGMLAYNPVSLMTKYLIENRSKTFYLPDYAAYRKNTKENLMQQIYDLADDGFIQYNPKTDSIYAQPKLYNYYFADKKVKDYDVLRFSSVIGAKSNASLNLLNNDITLEGIRRFNFSDSQNVIAVPTEQVVVIKGNRTLEFGGMMRAGRFDLFAKKFVFNYDQFAIQPTAIDSLRLYFPDKEGKMTKVNSVLTNLYGTLEIDKPTNKSGLTDFPEYPRFTTTKGSEITYERPETQNSQYKADNFKFIVDPFTIDSMDNFTVEGLQFDGTFVSADIFPDFRYQASIQEDFSLGFKKYTPAGGLPMYKGKGNGEMLISLSNKGLFGTGKIDYSGSTVESESFLLLPDKTLAIADKFTVPESAKYPVVNGAKLQTEWSPYSDNLKVATNESSTMKVFKMGYDFTGELKVTPTALKGNGMLAWDEAEFTSQNMIYGKNSVKADTSGIKIYAADPAKVAFQSVNLKSNIDFDKREGKFTSNIPGSLINLPFNQYASNLNDYKWNMDASTIDINLGNMAGAKPYFVSTLATQDSLKFEAKHALFNIKTGILAIDQIPYIDVADSRVFLWDGKATIRENAYMDRLDSSRIDANRVDKYHQFFNCQTYITGKNTLKSVGLFKYENRNGKQQVQFDSIYARDKVVYADAYIEEGDKFELDRKIAYKGIMRVRGNSPDPHLFGFAMPLHGFDSFASKWTRIRDSVDRNNVVLTFGIPQDEDGRNLPIGIYAYTSGTGYYPSFYGWKSRYSDDDIHLDTGILYYDYTRKELVMGSEAKIFKNALRGNVMRVDPEKSSLKAEGKMEMGFDYKQTDIKFAGEATFVEGDSSMTFNLLNLIEMPFPKELVDQITKMATEAGGTAVSITDPFVKKAYAAMLPEGEDVIKAIAKLEAEKKFKGTVQDSSGINTGILKDVKDITDKLLKKTVPRLIAFRVDGLRHSPQQRALFSKGKIDLYQVGDNMINRSFDCLYEIEKKRSGDNFSLYIEFDNNNWMYLNFIRGVLYVVSSDAAFNQSIPMLAEKADSEFFSIRLASARSVDRLRDQYADQP